LTSIPLARRARKSTILSSGDPGVRNHPQGMGKDPSPSVRSRRTRLRTLRRALDLGPDVEPKTIRHTVATRLRGLGVPPQQVESLPGHRIYRGSSAVYAKYDPNFLGDAKRALSTIFADTMLAALEWSAVHSLSKEGNAPRKVIVRDLAKE
jgi:integrase